MEIVRIYNNNVAAVKENDNKEMIVIGKGLAFQKRTGDEVDESKIDKIFTLQNPKIMTKLEELIKDMPSIYLSISEEIVEMIYRESDLEISENIYITLTDHISMSLEREKKGVVLKNPFMLEIKQFYKKEFALACNAAVIIKEQLNMEISEDEIGMIALHIVNASMNQNFQITMKATKMIQDIITIVKDFYHMEFDEEALRYQRFIRHLQFLTKRVLGKKESQESNEFLFRSVLHQFSEAGRCVQLINQYLQEQYQVSITKAEQEFLIYHIMSITMKKHHE